MPLQNQEMIMNKKTYFMFVHADPEGMWCEFPDLEGCMTDGENLEDLMKNAVDCTDLPDMVRQVGGGILLLFQETVSWATRKTFPPMILRISSSEKPLCTRPTVKSGQLVQLMELNSSSVTLEPPSPGSGQ